MQNLKYVVQRIASVRLIVAVTLGLAAGCTTDPASIEAGSRPTASSDVALVQSRDGTNRTKVVASRSAPRIQIEFGSHSAPIRAIALSPDQSLVVTASDDKTVRVWDARSGQLRHVIRPEIGAAEAGRMYALAIHPTEDLVAIAGTTGVHGGDHKILLFRTTTGEFVRSFDARGANIKRMAWSMAGTLLLATYDGNHGLRAFLPGGQMVFEDRYKGASYGLSVSRNGEFAAATSLDGTVHLYRVSGTSVSKHLAWQTALPGPRDLAFSPNSEQLVVAFIGTAQTPGAPTILDVATGSVVRQLVRPSLKKGDLRIVAWSEDGRFVHAGGSGYGTPGEHAIFTFSAASGRVDAQVLVARNSITDLTSAGDGGLLFSSFDGSWGRVQNNQFERQIGGDIADLRGFDSLQISDSGWQVAFRFSLYGQAAWFDLDERVLKLGGPATKVNAPNTRGSTTDSWQNVRTPKVNGRRIAIEPAEVARSIHYLSASRHALLGTSKALQRIDGSGQLVWRVATNAEVWSVNATRDARIAVTALSDGTIRWWRTADGELLMSLLMKPDGRWAAWTPQGYFDASTGADRLIGWSVNRADEPVADFFSLNRFRDQFNRPDVIDHLLDTADVGNAYERASAMRQTPVSQTVLKPGDGKVATAAQPGVAALPVNAVGTNKPVNSVGLNRPIAFKSIQDTFFPPIVRARGPGTLSLQDGGVTIPFSVKAQGPPEIEVRVNGKVNDQAQVKMPAQFDGKSPGAATLRAAVPGAIIQVIARDSNGVSEPLGFRIDVAPNNNSVGQATLPPVPNVSGPIVTMPTIADAAGSIAAALRPPEPIESLAIAPSSTLGTAELPRLFVLSVGISDYKNKDYELGLPAKDARDFVATVLQQKGRLYSSIQSRLLEDKQASRVETEKGLEWLRQSVGPQDTGILFLAGHGLNDANGDYFFLPWDADHENLNNTGVSEAAISQTLVRMRGRTILFVDTCHAGVVGSFRSATREVRKLANDLASAENGVIVFASSSGRQLSEEDETWGNGAFTKAVIQGLNGKADFRNTGKVTFKSLDFYVSEEVKRLTDGRQTPVTNIPVGVPDFALATLIN